ncbi:MAG: lantibiotic protection ABC transporter ATP-binding protein [Lachnospiraceae bacterium]|nr:lantibiotic protection ABC transporter ATP-binding protein [Lachnospiraceae bacterium]
MMETILETHHLSKRYKRQYANYDISLSVKRNTVYGLLGPNGAGKSTLLKALTGMVIPSSGEIVFDGKPWSRSDLAAIGALIESPPLYDNLTAYENLKVRTLLYDLPESRIDEVLETVALTDTGRKRAGHFSMGMKQRLGIAAALISHPKLLILDEPTNGLDPIGIGDLRRLIRSFPEQGITVILSSHMLSEVEQTADEIGIIANGRMWYEAPVHESEDLETLFLEVVKNSMEQAEQQDVMTKRQVV